MKTPQMNIHRLFHNFSNTKQSKSVTCSPVFSLVFSLVLIHIILLPLNFAYAQVKASVVAIVDGTAISSIDLENKDVNIWLSESDDNILLLVDKNDFNFSKSSSSTKNNPLKEKIFCLKRQYLSIPELKNIFLKCILFNNQLLVGETYNSSQNYVNIGYLIN